MHFRHLHHLNILLNLILNDYFYNSRCLLVFTDLRSSLSLRAHVPIIHFEALNASLIFRNFGCQDVIIYAYDTVSVFEQFEDLIRHSNERFNQRRYILVASNRLIFKSDALKYVSDVLLVQLAPDTSPAGTFELVTHRYRGASAHNEPILLDFWFASNQSFHRTNNLFPDKLRDQFGRAFLIGTVGYEPYAIVDVSTQTFDGTETSFVFEFCKKFNLTPTFNIVEEGDDLWGEVYTNWTGYGLLGTLLNDKTDIAYASIYAWDYYSNFFDYTKPLTRTRVTALVPAPKLASNISTPLLSFSGRAWIIISCLYVLSTFVLFLLLKRDSRATNKPKIRHQFAKAILAITEIYFNQTFRLPLNSRLIRLFMAVHLIYDVLVTTSYSSGLSSIMTLPRYQSGIKTVADLAQSGIKWGATTLSWIYSIQDANTTDYKKIQEQFVVRSSSELAKLGRTNDFGFSIERLPYGHYAIGKYVEREVISNYRVLQEDVYWDNVIFMIRKNAVLKPLLDRLILRVIESGIQSNWENRVVFEYMDATVQRTISFYTHNKIEHVVVKLQWTHVEGAFTLLLIGYLLAGLIFIYEIISFKQL